MNADEMKKRLKISGGKVENNMFITQYGAYMCDLLLSLDSAESDKELVLRHPFYQKYILAGYKLVIAPSFCNPNLAVYVENWQDLLKNAKTISGVEIVSTYEAFSNHFENEKSLRGL